MHPLLSEKVSVILLVAVAIKIILGFTNLAYAAGFRTLTHNDVEVGVWYPSNTATKSQRLGPFQIHVAKDAPISEGKHQIILFSHGNSGRYRNHFLTAQILADAGFIVIAPQHKADYLIGGSKTAAALNHRYNELELALKSVMAEKDFQDHVRSDVIHGLGYSLGGATILLASGAEFSTQLVEQYCEKNGQIDAEFCEDRGWIYRLFQSFQSSVTLPETTDPFQNTPLINGKIALVAPVFQGLNIKESISASSLTVFAIEGDIIAKPEFHAQPLAQSASNYIPTDIQSIPGHHFAFIAPFPKWLTDTEDIPVAVDPVGFDRVSFLNEINAKILSVFTNK